eukprot:2562717-Pyramimonas_sp.AAC.1
MRPFFLTPSSSLPRTRTLGSQIILCKSKLDSSVRGSIGPVRCVARVDSRRSPVTRLMGGTSEYERPLIGSSYVARRERKDSNSPKLNAGKA